MRSNLSVRALTVVALLIALLAVPVTAQAAPRDAPDDRDTPSFVQWAWDWISNMWGAGGGSWEPTGRTNGIAPPTEGTISVPQADGLRADRSVETLRERRFLLDR